MRIVSAGVHSFLRMSRQIAPVCELILGCHILVSNFICKEIWLTRPGQQGKISTAQAQDHRHILRAINCVKTYLRGLEGVLVGNHDVDDEGATSVTCVSLYREKSC